MRRTCESGQATVEAAFLLPVLFVGLLLLMQPGILLYDRLVDVYKRQVQEIVAAAQKTELYFTLPGSEGER